MSFREGGKKKKKVSKILMSVLDLGHWGVLLMIRSSETCMYNFKASTVCNIGICVKRTRDVIVKPHIHELWPRLRLF